MSTSQTNLANTPPADPHAAQDDAAIYLCFDRLRFPLILLVIYIHNASFTVTFSNGRAGSDGERFQIFAVDLLSNGVARVAVPLFFFMSGYLFFHERQFSRYLYSKKVVSRIRTLLIPFMLWNSVNLLFYFIAQSNPITAPWFGGTVPNLRHLSFLQLINVSFGIGGLPIAYQFWFIRDLMILVVLTPLVWMTARFAGPIAALVLILLWLTMPYQLSVPGIEPTLFFFLGSYCALRSVPILAVSRFRYAFAAVAMGLFTLAALHLSPGATRGAACAGIACGLAAALGWSTMLSERCSALFSRLSRVSFFIFAVHEPLLQIFRKILYRAWPMTPCIAMATYLLLPLLIAGLALGMFALARVTTPRLLALSTGQRS